MIAKDRLEAVKVTITDMDAVAALIYEYELKLQKLNDGRKR